MSDTDTPTPPPSRCTHGHGAFHHRRGGLLRRAARLTVLLGLFVGLPYAVARAASGHGACGAHGFGHPDSEAELRDDLGRAADRALGRVDATEEQRAQVDAALDTLAPRLWALRDEHEAVRVQVHDALTADTVDRAALDAARDRGLAAADQAAAAVGDALYDAGSALSPEQRRALVDALERYAE